MTDEKENAERKIIAEERRGQILTAALKCFASGIGTRLELLDAQNTLTEAQTNAASAGYDVRIAQAERARAVGN